MEAGLSPPYTDCATDIGNMAPGVAGSIASGDTLACRQYTSRDPNGPIVMRECLPTPHARSSESEMSRRLYQRTP